MTEKIVRDCAAEFARELSKYSTKLDLASWKTPGITLRVTFTRESGPRLELTFQNDGFGSVVKHTSLGMLMDEVYRREHYDTKAEMSVDIESSALRSLTHQSTLSTEE